MAAEVIVPRSMLESKRKLPRSSTLMSTTCPAVSANLPLKVKSVSKVLMAAHACAATDGESAVYLTRMPIRRS